MLKGVYTYSKTKQKKKEKENKKDHSGIVGTLSTLSDSGKISVCGVTLDLVQLIFNYKASVTIKVANTQQWGKHFLLTLTNSMDANATIIERIKTNQADQWGQSAAMRSPVDRQREREGVT